MDLRTVRREDFERLLDETFTLETGGVTLDLRLSQTSAAPRAGQPGQRDPFSIVLLGPGEPVLGQGTYAIGHPALGKAEIFVVPIGPGREGGMRYEAVFG